MTKRHVVTALLLGFFLCTVASANVLQVKTVDIGQSGGRTGALGDELEIGDQLGVEIWLNWRPGTNYGGGAPNYSHYGGYWIDGLDLDMSVSGAGSGNLDANSNIAIHARHGALAAYGQWSVDAATQAGSGTSVPVQVGNAYGGFSHAGANDIPYATGWSFTATDGGETTIGLATDPGTTSSGATTNAMNKYADYNTSWWGYNNGTLYDLDSSNMGSATVNVVPEPATILMMLIAGLALFMRRRK